MAAEAWGASWEGEGMSGHLGLPVSRGLRQGFVEGTISITDGPEESGSTLRFEVDNTFTRLNWTACLILAVGALGGIIATLWPFFPNLLPLAPAGIVLAIAAWLLVASRLRTADVEDFFALVELSPEVADFTQANRTIERR